MADDANFKRQEWFPAPVSGQTRSSAFAAFTPYNDTGQLSYEQRWSTNHGQLASGRWTGGGPFTLSRDMERFSPVPFQFTKYTGSGSNILAQGTARMAGPTSAVTSLSQPSMDSDVALNSFGTQAVAMTEPLNPAFDLSTFVGELLREGVPNIPGSQLRERTKLAKASGSEYLNVEFGWAPLVRGVQDFARTVRKSEEILTRHNRNANRVIRKSYEWPTEDSTRADACSFSMVPPVGFFTGGGRHQIARKKRWFEVEYIYYLPTGGATSDKIQRYASNARKLLGVDLSPEVLWNLSPWSWAADWFGTVGDVMHNVSALGQDGLVMRHGYIMCHTLLQVSDYGVNSINLKPMTRILTKETKVRRGATPFGFGVAFESLTPKQLAILAALGLSRW
jgi:hypothetical protein